MTTTLEQGSNADLSAARAAAVWTIAGFVLYLVGGVASLLLIALVENVFLQPIGLRPEAGTLSLSIQNGVHQLAWGLLVAGVAAPLGRRLVPSIRFTATGWAVLVAGLLIASLAVTLGDEFVRVRFEYYDPEYQGLTLFSGPALVAVALATWATLAVPAGSAALPIAAALTAAAGFAISLVPSIPGAWDGIRGDSVPLLAAFAGGLVYAMASVILVVRHVAGGPGDQRRR